VYRLCVGGRLPRKGPRRQGNRATSSEDGPRRSPLRARRIWVVRPSGNIPPLRWVCLRPPARGPCWRDWDNPMQVSSAVSIGLMAVPYRPFTGKDEVDERRNRIILDSVAGLPNIFPLTTTIE